MIQKSYLCVVAAIKVSDKNKRRKQAIKISDKKKKGKIVP